MCGFAGFVGHSLEIPSPVVLQHVSSELSRRGPNSSDHVFNPDHGLFLFHSRLSIQDLSSAASQPMRYKDLTLVFNGEIYNKNTVAKTLPPHIKSTLSTTSDTEVLLKSIYHNGFFETLAMIDGMFSVALYNHRNITLYLARDSFGEKPLYYHSANSHIVFGSVVSALLPLLPFTPTISAFAHFQYSLFSYVPSPYSIYEEIHKLPPGHALIWNQNDEPVVKPYLVNNNTSFQSSKADPVDALHSALSSSISSRLLSDVPVGAFLSGGIDSTLVAILMQNLTSSPIKTFSIGFQDASYDESPYSTHVARLIGSDHTSLVLSEKELADTFYILPDVYDEPFADSSQLPTIKLCQLAAQSVTVALGGDGADELFCGYNRHNLGFTLYNILRHDRTVTPFLLGALQDGLDSELFTSLLRYISYDGSHPSTLVSKLLRSLGSSNIDEYYDSVVTCPLSPGLLSVEGKPVNPLRSSVKNPSNARYMMKRDQLSYLPDDILVKTDRASMFSSLELRSPFLAPELVAVSNQFPLSALSNGVNGKLILKKLLARQPGFENYKRLKKGFGIPLSALLRGPLLDISSDLIHDPSAYGHRLYNKPEVVRLWSSFLSGSTVSTSLLWNILCFQFWYAKRS